MTLFMLELMQKAASIILIMVGYVSTKYSVHGLFNEKHTHKHSLATPSLHLFDEGEMMLVMVMMPISRGPPLKYLSVQAERDHM